MSNEDLTKEMNMKMEIGHEPEEDAQLQEEDGQLTQIDPETFYDLLMEQQEQM